MLGNIEWNTAFGGVEERVVMGVEAERCWDSTGC